MRLILTIPISMIFVIASMKLNMPTDQIMFILAIIVAGGLAGGDK